MRVLHLFSNWKWTGPAEPAVNLAAQCARSGADVRFLCGTPPEGGNSCFVSKARERDLEAKTPLILSKHRRIMGNKADTSKLRGIMDDFRPDIVHCHMYNDTRIALGAAGKAKERPKIVRTLYYGEPADVPAGDRSVILDVDGLIAVSTQVKDYIVSEIGYENVTRIHTGVDLERFNPDNTTCNAREKWNVRDDAPVIGIVSRIQKKRRFDMLFEAFAKLLALRRNVVLVIVGRGTREKELTQVLPQKMGIADSVVLTGYLDGAEYVDALAAFDCLVYPVPGTDGSCRTVREAMAMGLPVVSTQRGMLNELVEDGATGMTSQENADELCGAMEKVLSSRQALTAMSRRARNKALKDFSVEKQAEAVTLFYGTVLER